MLGKKTSSFKKLVKRVKVTGEANTKKEPSSQYESLLKEFEYDDIQSQATTPTGFFALYVGEEKQRFVVPTGYLSHPLFKILLEKASDEYGFKHHNGLVVPCSVSTFQGVVNAVESCNGKFEFGKLGQDFI